jgi:hypothetical protein
VSADLIGIETRAAHVIVGAGLLAIPADQDTAWVPNHSKRAPACFLRDGGSPAARWRAA